MKQFKFNSDKPNFPLFIQLELKHGDIPALVLPHHMFIWTPQNAVNRAMTHPPRHAGLCLPPLSG